MATPILRPYQVEGAEFLKVHGRAILADEPGLGKTAQALVAAKWSGAKRILVVAPKSAAGVWEEELQTWWPEFPGKFVYYQGTKRKYKDLATPGPILVATNYALLEETLKGFFWDLIVWDESHKLKSRQMKKGRLSGQLFAVAKRHASARRHYFLTGSPIRHGAHDLWTTLHLINPVRYKSFWDFAQKYCVVYRDEFGMHIEGVRDEAALRAELGGIMLRRRKDDSLPGLPPKQRQFLNAEMSAKERKAYDELKREWLIETAGGELLAVSTKLALLTRLRQFLVHPALIGLDIDSSAFTVLKDQAEANGEPVVVFSPFTAAFDLLEDMFARMRWSTWRVQGGMSAQRITAAVRAFQTAQAPERALLVSLGSAISFTANSASTSYHLGFDWSVDVNTQAEDRIHRESEARRMSNFVLNRYIVHPSTIDAHLRKVLAQKESWSRLVLDPERLLAPSWRDNDS